MGWWTRPHRQTRAVARHHRFWDFFRKLFAETLGARRSSYAAGRFSFNRERPLPQLRRRGRAHHRDELLARREGALQKPATARFSETLAVTWRGKSIGDVLQMEVDGAVEFFASMPYRAPAATAQTWAWAASPWASHRPRSAAAAQHIKLVTELTKVRDEVGAAGAEGPTAHPVCARRPTVEPAHARRAQTHPRAAPPGRWWAGVVVIERPG